MLSLLLFIIVLEALPTEVRSEFLEELHNRDAFALVSETLKGLKWRTEA